MAPMESLNTVREIMAVFMVEVLTMLIVFLKWPTAASKYFQFNIRSMKSWLVEIKLKIGFMTMVN